MNGYDLSRNWFDWCFENPDLITPTHTAMYFFIIEHWNRLGQKEKFGLPMEMTKDAIGVKNYRTFSKVFNDLISWGFIKLLQKSKNQYSANVIAIVENTKANTKALTKAMQKHLQKQVHGIVGIDKPNNNEPNNKGIEDRKLKFYETLKPFVEKYGEEMIFGKTGFFKYWTEPNKSNTKFRQELQPTWSIDRRLDTWASNNKQFNTTKPKTETSGPSGNLRL